MTYALQADGTDVAICDDCGDEIGDGEGCDHGGRDHCGACFLQHCRDCQRDMTDDMRAEMRMDWDR